MSDFLLDSEVDPAKFKQLVKYIVQLEQTNNKTNQKTSNEMIRAIGREIREKVTCL